MNMDLEVLESDGSKFLDIGQSGGELPSSNNWPTGQLTPPTLIGGLNRFPLNPYVTKLFKKHPS